MTPNECAFIAEGLAYQIGVLSPSRQLALSLSKALMETSKFRDFNGIPSRVANMLARLDRANRGAEETGQPFAKFQYSCCARINVDDWHTDKLQTNALRVESCIGSPIRCGERMPEHWAEGAKRRGSGIWLFSGGSPFVFAPCEKKFCPRWNNASERPTT